MKTLAAMQPYFFPYLGYFKLMSEADVFLLYGEVSFRKKSWITRNRFQRPEDGRIYSLSVPIAAKNSRESIRATRLADFELWRSNFLKALIGNYQTAAYFGPTYAWLLKILTSKFTTIHELNAHCLCAVARLLEISSQIVVSDNTFSPLESELSRLYDHGNEAGRTDRVIRLAQSLSCTRYLNPESGRELYDEAAMTREKIEFVGVSFAPPSYRTVRRQAEPGLSIIDVLMHNGEARTRELLADCNATFV